ncbi:MAG: glycosyltransferase [Pseudomonadota bacterium]
MQILFLHNNFPAQFGGLGAHLVEHGWQVWFGTQRKGARAPHLNVFVYEPHRAPEDGVHPYSSTWEKAVINGQSVARAGLKIGPRDLSPDIVVSHSGWGPGLFAKDVWPNARTVGYFEWYYNAPGPDVAFLDPTPPTADQRARSRCRNAPILLDLVSVDLGICPTQWQKSQFPSEFGKKLLVHHDGVDTDYYRPTGKEGLRLEGLDLPADAEIVTYVARGMEPYRGFPQFMSALARLQKRRPNVHAVIVGEDRVAYGKKLEEGDSHLKRVKADLDLDMARTHFVGYLGRDDYRKVLRASSAHVYLTVPFVLSWSMMEAMSTACLLVASDTAPVREVVNSENGILVDFNDPDAIAEGLYEALENPAAHQERRAAARATILAKYDADKLLNEKRKMFDALARRGASADRRDDAQPKQAVAGLKRSASTAA